jgi:hypothetical protein
MLAAPSLVTAQLPGIMPGSTTQPATPNPLFPVDLGIPWLNVPELSPHRQLPSPALPPSQAPSIISTNRGRFPFPISPSPITHPEIIYVGNIPVVVMPLPLPPNPIVARLQSSGFLLQVPMIQSPVEHAGKQ